MTTSSRLLERFVEHHNVHLQPDMDQGRVKNSVKDYLLRLFNTRKGSVIVDNEFGLGSFRDVDTQAPEAFFEQLEVQLLAYEPRVEACRFSLIQNNQVQVVMCVLMELEIKPMSAYEDEGIKLDLIGKFMADGTFCIED